MTTTKRTSFTGTPDDGLFSGQKNSVFFSPALLESRVGNEIEIDGIGLSSTMQDSYSFPSSPNTRRFVFGPNSTSRTNNSLYRTLFAEPTVTATMVQTMPPGPTTIFKFK